MSYGAPTETKRPLNAGLSISIEMREKMLAPPKGVSPSFDIIVGYLVKFLHAAGLRARRILSSHQKCLNNGKQREAKNRKC